MKTNRTLLIASPLISLLVGGTALAGEDPCGKFDFSAGVKCEIKVEGGCETECAPVHFSAACDGGCDATASVDCPINCKAECVAECDPGAINCQASCGADCKSRCNSACSLDDCSAECDASCSSECAASCAVDPPSCDASCDASCKGSCDVEANINCDIDCYTNLEGGCKTQCYEPSGALFCNGQYVGASDVDACITYIRDNLKGEVNVEARGEVTCDLANGCESSSSSNTGSGGCSIGDAGAAAGGTGALAALGLALGAVIRRRRRGA